MTRSRSAMTLTGIGLLAVGVFFLARKLPAPADRTIVVEAHKYGYAPGVIKVNKGDRITLRFASTDVTHGFFLEGYDLEAKARPEMPRFWIRRPSTGEDFREVDEVHIRADREGKFRFRCSMTCGYMHPFMQGELIVQPNRLFPVSVLLSVCVTVMTLLWYGGGSPSAARRSHGARVARTVARWSHSAGASCAQDSDR